MGSNGEFLNGHEGRTVAMQKIDETHYRVNADERISMAVAVDPRPYLASFEAEI